MENFMKRNYRLFLCILLSMPVLLLSGCDLPSRLNFGKTSGSGESISKSGFYFNTVITVTLYGTKDETLLDDCFSLADTYENYFSNTIADSDVSKINAAGGAPVTVHEETAELIKKGLYYGDLSNGKFDITIGKLSDLWDISTKALLEKTDASMIPSDDEIKKALSTVDYQNVVVDGNTVTLKDPSAKIDLGGIAKGYIADRMKDYLNHKGAACGYINLGGNVLCLGAKPDGSSYNIGIQRPFDDEGAAMLAVSVTDQTVVSSGVYERYFEVDGKRYHHILDTATGYPYDNGLLGVSIITDESVDGDGLSTTCFALGLADGMALVESLDNTEAVFITEDYELHFSSGMGTKIPYQVME
jgi:thiamine biosynthesis lipoprotein